MSIYQAMYELIHSYIYGGVALTPSMTLVCDFTATACSLLIIALPFLVVYGAIKLITR